MSFDYVMEIACIWTITLLYIYLYVWKFFFFFFFLNQQFITQGAMTDRSNYLVATIHWWANYMKNKEKEKETT